MHYKIANLAFGAFTKNRLQPLQNILHRLPLLQQRILYRIVASVWQSLQCTSATLPRVHWVVALSALLIRA